MEIIIPKKLATPLGIIKIYDNSTEIKYKIAKLECDSTRFPNIYDRYQLIVEYETDMFPHLIYCVLEGVNLNKAKSHIESGEKLECISIYQNNIKLSIGIEADTDYLDGKRISSYDYDSIYLHNGLGYYIFPTTKSQSLVFGIAWINKYNDINEIQTWYAADPTSMK